MLVGGSLGASVVSADHITWIDKKQGANGVSCCGHRDCFSTTVALLQQDERETTVMIGDDIVTVPTAIVHPSEDPHGQGWVCFKPKEEAIPRNSGGWRIPTYQGADGREHAIRPERFTRENVRCVFPISLN
jgi:hypothetical protein